MFFSKNKTQRIEIFDDENSRVYRLENGKAFKLLLHFPLVKMFFFFSKKNFFREIM